MVIDFDCPFCGVYNVIEDEIECISDTEPYTIKSKCEACSGDYAVEVSIKAVKLVFEEEE